MTTVLADPSLISVAGAGLAVSFLHAALPTHWLPFVLVGRAQGWRAGRALGVVALAGAAHIGSTALVGGLIVMAGLALDQWVAGILPYISAAVLFGFGLFYLGRAAQRRRNASHAPPPSASDRAATLGLVALMAVSPGEILLPFYLNAASLGVFALAGLTLVFAIGTIGGMALLAGAAYAGASLLRLERLARHEGVILGLALIGLALFLVLNPA